ncbi:MAG: hypothetical protein ABI315_13180 [Bacteroidia bacterium]
MVKSTKYKTITDYLLVWGLIAISGFDFFMPQMNIAILFLFAVFIFFKRNIPFNSSYLKVILFFLLIEVIQFLLIPGYDPKLILGTQLRLFVGLFIITITGVKFINYYINIIYFFSIVSFIFFIPCVISPNVYHFFVDSVCPFFVSPFAEPNVFYTPPATNILFCFHEVIIEEFRNPGPFWEPGAFAIFLNLALIFNLIIHKNVWTKKNIVLSLALISTLSTSGYIAFFLLIFAFYTINQSLFKRIMYGIFLLPILIGLYFSLDFLNKKVEKNISLAGTTTTSRFGSAEADYKDFLNSPIIGWGRGEATRYGGKTVAFFTVDQHRNNGATDLLATYGIFLTVFCFYYYFKAFKAICIYSNFNQGFAFYAFIILFLLGFSQGIFQYAFFKSLLFLNVTYSINFKQKEIT